MGNKGNPHIKEACLYRINELFDGWDNWIDSYITENGTYGRRIVGTVGGASARQTLIEALKQVVGPGQFLADVFFDSRRIVLDELVVVPVTTLAVDLHVTRCHREAFQSYAVGLRGQLQDGNDGIHLRPLINNPLIKNHSSIIIQFASWFDLFN